MLHLNYYANIFCFLAKKKKIEKVVDEMITSGNSAVGFFTKMAFLNVNINSQSTFLVRLNWTENTGEFSVFDYENCKTWKGRVCVDKLDCHYLFCLWQ